MSDCPIKIPKGYYVRHNCLVHPTQSSGINQSGFIFGKVRWKKCVKTFVCIFVVILSNISYQIISFHEMINLIRWKEIEVHSGTIETWYVWYNWSQAVFLYLNNQLHSSFNPFHSMRFQYFALISSGMRSTHVHLAIVTLIMT